MRSAREPTRRAVVDQIASRDTRALFSAADAFAGSVDRSAAEARRARALAAYTAMLDEAGVSAIALPTEVAPPPLVAADGDGPADMVRIGDTDVPKTEALVRNTRIACALGIPALSLPAGLDGSGLPVGLEIEGRAGADAELLGLGVAVERALAS